MEDKLVNKAFVNRNVSKKTTSVLFLFGLWLFQLSSSSGCVQRWMRENGELYPLKYFYSVCITNRSSEFAAAAKKYFGLVFREVCSVKINSTSQIQSTFFSCNSEMAQSFSVFYFWCIQLFWRKILYKGKQNIPIFCTSASPIPWNFYCCQWWVILWSSICSG